MAEYVPRLVTKYKKEVAPYLQKNFGYKNTNQIPRLLKININAGVGEAIQDSKTLEGAVNDLAIISGQKPIITKAKKAISNFKLRKGMKIGCKVTLRRQRMWEFLDRYIAIAVPRIRDFRGYSDKSFDGRGNYSLGVKEQIIFPEINVDKIDKIRGLDITFVTSAKTDEEGFEMLKALGFPFRKKEE
ncbi:MAG: 50S ribosomal protein L5 [Calditrichales bacterium]|nr:50S ribosomal protein L5 [Calditrichales bacterium]